MKTEQTPKHTPGPWTAIKEYDGWAIIKKDGGLGRMYIANEICQGETDGEADAKLIASAPILKALNNELLEALEESTIQIKYLHEKFVKSGGTGTGTGNAVISRNESIISKCKDL